MIWQRLLLREILKSFSLVLFGFFFLYCALDYSFHMQDFIKSKNIHLTDFALYYGHIFIKRAELLVPLAMLIATIKVLSTLNAHRELLALQVAGLNFKKITKPFFLLATGCTLFTIASTEWLIPHSTLYLDQFHNAHFSQSQKPHGNLMKKEKLHVLSLKDRSKVIYQYFDRSKEAYFDLVWVRTPDDIWRIKYLDIGGKDPTGHFADHFVRNKGGFFEKESSHITHAFSPLKWIKESAENPFIPYESRKASELWSVAHRSTTTAYEKAEILTHFYYKSAMPLLPLFVVIVAAPFCVRYSRGQSPFLTYALGIFGYVAFYLLANACFILGENNICSPWVAIYTPFILCGGFFWKFAKTQ